MPNNTEHIPTPGGGGDENIDIEINIPRRDYSYLYDLIKGVAIVWGVNILANLVGALVLKSTEISPLAFTLVATFFVMITAFAVATYFMVIKPRRSFAEGFAIRKISPVSALGYSALAVGLAFLLNSIEPETAQQNSPLYEILSTTSGKIAIAALIPFASLIEEFYYRGFILPILLKYIKPWIAIVIVAGWFAAAHIPEYAGNPFAVIAVFALGLILTLARYYAKSLTPSLLTHLIYNTTTIILVFLYL